MCIRDSLIQKVHTQDPGLYNSFGIFRSNFMSIVGHNGDLDFYHGTLRARDDNGKLIFDGVDYEQYDKYIEEEVRPWTYMKFPFFKSLGKELGLSLIHI